jgi:hypothetical protein
MIFLFLMGIAVTELVVLLGYLILSFLIAKFIGSNRTIGFTGSLIVCIIFSPVFGLIITLLSKKTSA